MFSKRFFRLQPLFICIASLVIAEIDANHLYDDICAEPTFDASVAITESHILLFKNDYIWLLELDQYQLTSSISLRSIVDSCMGPGLATNVSPPYYAWSMHDSFKPQMDSICFHYDNQFCHFSMQPHIGTSSFELLPLPLHDKSYMEELCRKDVKKDTIEIMLMRLKFYNPKTLKSLWLFGRNFKALIKIVPTTYDPSNIILKVELFKLYREVRPIYERPDSINPIESNRTIFDDQIIDGVYTFTVLPHGQLMVFFASQFCYISPYDFECNLRDMSTLLGCTTPANEILEKRVYIVPHISDSNRNSASAHSMVNNESTHITNWTQSKSTSPPSMGIGHPVQSVQSNEPSTSTVSSSSSITTNTVHQFTHNSEKSNPVSIVFSVTDSSNTSNGATSSSGTIADINSQNSSSNSSSSSSYAGRSIINSIPFTLSTTTTTTTSTPTSTSAPKSDNDSILYHRRASFNEEHITQSEIEWLNSQTSLHYLFIGFKLFGKLFLRALFLFVSTILIVTVLMALLLFVTYRFVKFDYQVLFLICQIMFIQELRSY